jgi:hypothetical protein
LLTLDNQKLTKDSLSETNFEKVYDPSKLVHTDYPEEKVDFDSDGTYSIYNWELFFHVPLYIAVNLTRNQRFAEAMDWFHFIFNPTSSSKIPSPQRYWNFLPFYKNTDPEEDQIFNLLAVLSYDGNDKYLKKLKQQVEGQVEAWRENPFNPHLIARLRITAYQKNVVMKYIDNIIAWGDQLFRQDTMESVN